MNKNLYLLLFLLFQSLAIYAGEKVKPSDLDLYLCIGQSNMAGRADLTPEIMDTLQNVYLLNNKGHFQQSERTYQCNV